MEGSLLRVFVFLMASRGGAGQLLGEFCYSPVKGPQSHLKAHYCPGLQDPANAQFCCGTCSEPFCCASQKNSLDPTQCPGFNQVPEVTSPTTPKVTSPTTPKVTSPTTPKVTSLTTHVLAKHGRVNILWWFIGIMVGTVVVWSLCRNYRVFQCRRFCGDNEEEEEEREEVEMESRDPSPAPSPRIHLPPPSPPRNLDYPPPYSAVDPLASLPAPLANASRSPPEGASPARLRGAEGGSPPRLRGAEGGDLPPPYPDDPPPYSDIDPFAPASLPPVVSAPRRNRRARASRSVQRAPAEPAGAAGGAPAEPPRAEGGVPPEPSGAEAGEAFAT